MAGPPPAVALTRLAVRRALALRPVPAPLTPTKTGFSPGGPLIDGSPGENPVLAKGGGPPERQRLLAAVSGGADSLALAAALAFEGQRSGFSVGAVVIDHGLQPESADVAEAAAKQCRDLGLAPVEVIRVDVALSSGEGLEAAARTARYAALEEARVRLAATYIVLGHTRDDQAEQVLLGLARGSGTRSLSGMSRRTETLLRPFLEITAAETREACRDQRLAVWDDPHNQDPRFLRVRVREVLDEVEAQVGPGVRAGLARSADLLRADGAALDELAEAAYARLLQPDDLTAIGVPDAVQTESGTPIAVEAGDGAGGGSARGSLAAEALTDLPTALRTRVIRLLLLDAGADSAALASSHIGWVDDLVMRWKGQGPVDVPGGLQASRTDGRIEVARRGPVQ